jgi:hypothetical protein
MRLTPQAVLGLGAIVFGVLLTLDNLHLADTWRYVRYWPFVVIAAGLVQLLVSESRSGRIVGVIVMSVGAILTAEHVYGMPVDVDDFWPLGLIAIGVLVLTRARQRAAESSPAGSGASGGAAPERPPWDVAGQSGPGLSASLDSGAPQPSDPPSVCGFTTTTDQVVNEFAVWAGKQRRNASSAFRRAELTAVMGGIELDLRAASTATGEAVIDVFVMWGGVEIWVPPDWAVSNQVSLLMGGAEDKSTGTQNARHRLIVRGFVIMGGLEIKT